MRPFWIFDFGFWIRRAARKHILYSALCAMLFALCSSAEAQQSKKVHRIGYLNSSPRVVTALEKTRRDAFRQGLQELGYVEGKNIVIERRYGEGKFERTSELAAELVRQKVEVIVTAGGGSTRAAKRVTATIPIVMTQDTDPVRNGFIASLARPGGNITGLSRVAPELSGKQVELLKEMVPKLDRLAILGSSTQPANAQILKEIEVASGSLGIKLKYFDVQGPNDFETTFRDASKGRADAILMLVSGPIYNPHRKQLVELAAKSRLPAIYRNRKDVEAGGLMSYGVHLPDLDRRAASFVDKILKGAKQIGLTIPPNILARADRVIR